MIGLVNASFNDSGDDGVLRAAPADLDFTLPVEPGYRERPPKGSWEAGYQLSLLALEQVKDCPDIWERRKAQSVTVEFAM